jgi:hypothetical protein
VAGAAALVIVAGAAALAAGAGSPSPRPGAPPAGGTASRAGTALPGSTALPASAAAPESPYAGVPADHVTALPASALPGPAAGAGAGAGRDEVVTLVVLSGAPSVSVRVGRLGGELLEAATAPGYGARPVAEVNGAGGDARSAGVIGLSLEAAGSAAGAGLAGGAQLSVTLSADVTWQLDFGGGTSQLTADLTGGRVAGLDFGQGSSQVRVTLPRPDGTTLVRLDGGASQLSGTVLAQPGWAGAASRVDVDATTGASQISVTAGGAAGAPGAGS